VIHSAYLLEDLKRQQATVDKVKKVLTFLSAFEESSAECISNMLIRFSGSKYEDGIIQAGKFICHIEALFASIDSIDIQLKKAGDTQGIDCGKDPKNLARKIVFFFSLLSKSQLPNEHEDATKELISLVTSLARILKSLIRTALTAALRLVKLNNNSTYVGTKI
jgi:hypothetical protein